MIANDINLNIGGGSRNRERRVELRAIEEEIMSRVWL